MKMRIRPTVTIIMLVATVLLGALMPMDATAGQKSIVGSWIVDVTSDQPGPPPFRPLYEHLGWPRAEYGPRARDR